MALPDRCRTTMLLDILVYLVVMQVEYEQYDMIQSAAAWGPVTPL